MELKQLHIFLKVCELMNITEAARQLNYSQSSVSDSISKLEESLGVSLFDRIKKRIHLTDKGEMLKQYALKMISLEQEVLEAMTSSECQIRVGIIESLGAYMFSSFFREYMEEHHNITINFIIARCEEIPDLLKKHQIDFGITLDEVILDTDILSTPLFEEEIVFIKSRNHDSKTYETYEDLNHEKVIISKGYVGYNILFYDIYDKYGIDIGPITYMESLEGIKSYVKEGFGISFMPYTVIRQDLVKEELSTFHINNERHYHVVQVLEYKHKQLKEPIQDLIDTFIESFKKKNG